MVLQALLLHQSHQPWLMMLKIKFLNMNMKNETDMLGPYGVMQVEVFSALRSGILVVFWNLVKEARSLPWDDEYLVWVCFWQNCWPENYHTISYCWWNKYHTLSSVNSNDKNYHWLLCGIWACPNCMIRNDSWWWCMIIVHVQKRMVALSSTIITACTGLRRQFFRGNSHPWESLHRVVTCFVVTIIL